MRKYPEQAGSEIRIAYGRELILGLETHAETKPLADAMRVAQDALLARYTERVADEETLTRARVTLRFADHALDRAVRVLRRQAELLDGGRVGPLTLAVFPDGLVAETAPTGEHQERRARALVARVRELTVAHADALRAQALDALVIALDAFSTARAAYDTANASVSSRFAKERLARDAHRIQLQRTIGEMTTLFPDDRAMRDLFFPDVRTPGPRAPEPEDDVPA